MNSTQLEKGNAIQEQIEVLGQHKKNIEHAISQEGDHVRIQGGVVYLANQILAEAGLPSGKQIMEAYVNQLQINIARLEKDFEAL